MVGGGGVDVSKVPLLQGLRYHPVKSTRAAETPPLTPRLLDSNVPPLCLLSGAHVPSRARTAHLRGSLIWRDVCRDSLGGGWLLYLRTPWISSVLPERCLTLPWGPPLGPVPAPTQTRLWREVRVQVHILPASYYRYDLGQVQLPLSAFQVSELHNGGKNGKDWVSQGGERTQMSQPQVGALFPRAQWPGVRGFQRGRCVWRASSLRTMRKY